ncbi:MAG: hypothetical protein AAEJ04_02725 [Planctomycetota bacterium]
MTAISWTHMLLLISVLLGQNPLQQDRNPLQNYSLPPIYPILDRDFPVSLIGKSTSKRCTTVLAIRCGARFDQENGGSAARAALLATCSIIADPPYPTGSIFTRAEIGGDDAVIFIHHDAEDLLRLLKRLQIALNGSPATDRCPSAIADLQENQTKPSQPCSCITICNCQPRHILAQRIIEGLDPLPWGARRSGCPRRAKKLTAKIVDRWRIDHLRFDRAALAIDTGLNLNQILPRQDAIRNIREAFSQVVAVPEFAQQTIDFLEPVKTILSPPKIDNGKSPAVFAGWLADRNSPGEAIPLLEPRIEIWQEILASEEAAPTALLRLLAKRSAFRIGPQKAPEPLPPVNPASIALQLLRRNDPALPDVLSRRARRGALIAELRQEQWP